MADNADSDSDVEFPVSRKRKFNVINVEESESDEDDEDSDSEGEDEEDESDEEESGDDDDDDDDDAVNDIDLADDINNDQCSICLMEFTDQLLGIPNSCSHIFCSVCLQEWSKNINTCPVDRKVFYTIAIRKNKDGPVIDQIEVVDRTQKKEDEYEDPTACEICGVGDREDTMLLCDGCDRGFHLECLTPSLDSVPEGEWFCNDCFIVNPSRDTSEEPQFDTSLFDEEISSGQQEGEYSSVAPRPAAPSRASTSQPRRARTVATRRRRRRARRRTGSRQMRRHTPRAKSSIKVESSSRGASTSTSRFKRKPKKKRRKKKRRKTRRGKKKPEENDKKKRRCGDVSPSRYLLPHQMVPSATFSLFGSDFDLEYLPVVEAPARVTSPRSQEPTPYSTSNPDVLGSIFTGLDTLHDKSLSMDCSGRLKIPKAEKVIPKAEKVIPKDEHVIPKHEQVIPKHEQVIPKDEKVIPIKDEKVIPKDHTKYEKSESPSVVNEKRIKRFDTNLTGGKSSAPKTFSTIFGSSSSTNTSCEGANKDTLNSERVKNLKAPEHKRHKVSKYGETSARRLKRSKNKPYGYALATYKIPRKKSTVVSSSLDETSAAKAPSPKSVKDSKCTGSPVNKASHTLVQGSLGYSQPNTGILHLIPETQCEERPREIRLGTSQGIPVNNNSTWKDSKSSVADRNFPKKASYTAGVGRDSTHNSSTTTSYVGGVIEESSSLVSLRNFPKSTTCTRDSTPVSGQDFTKITSHTPNVGHNAVSPVNISDFKKTNLSSTKFDSGGESNRNAAFKSSFHKHVSTASAKSIPEGFKKASSRGDLVQTATNLYLIEMLKQKKSTLYDTGSVSSAVRFEGVASTSRVAVLPPLRPAGSSTRPVAVVHPTKQESTVGFGKLSDADAAKRRKEGIERLCRKQKISDEVKEALKPYYRCKEISKEAYKYIYKRAVEKIRESSCPVESRGVCTLVKNYVNYVKGHQKTTKANS